LHLSTSARYSDGAVFEAGAGSGVSGATVFLARGKGLRKSRSALSRRFWACA